MANGDGKRTGKRRYKPRSEYRALTHELRRDIIRMRAKGYTYKQIREALHTSNGSIEVVLRDYGGVFSSDQWWEPKSRFRLSFEERCEIYAGITAGVGLTEVARELGRAASTVYEEAKRNGGRDRYKPVVAHQRALEMARRPKATRLSTRPELCARVIDDLEHFWSPKQIEQRLRSEFPADPEMWVSHETIYKTLYIQGRGEFRRELSRCLRSGRAQRVNRSETRQVPGRIRDMLPISERPAEVEDRAVPGHWEGDLIIGKDNASAIGTLVERSTRFVMLLHLPDGYRAEQVRDAMTKKIMTLPETLRRSLTWDQGKEMAEHVQFTIDSNIAVYFCDPHSPWQRGSNENTNGLLRQYFPKGEDLKRYSAEELDAAADSLNNRPRQTLSWMKPSEKLAGLLAVTP